MSCYNSKLEWYSAPIVRFSRASAGACGILVFVISPNILKMCAQKWLACQGSGTISMRFFDTSPIE